MKENIDFRPLATADEAEHCARLMSASEPWITLQRDFEKSLATIQDPSREVYVAYVGDALVGFAILCMVGAFTGYLQTLCVEPGWRGSGIGSAMVARAEERIFREWPNVFMCVSSFNGGARRLYERLGYQVVGELEDYIVQGHSELILRKTRGPLNITT